MDYTAQLEETLDAIAEGKASTWSTCAPGGRTSSAAWEQPLRSGAAAARAPRTRRGRARRSQAHREAVSPLREGELLLCPGKRGEFLACSRWRATLKCDYTAPPDVKAAARLPSVQQGHGGGAGKSGPYVRCLDKDGCGYMGDVDAQPHRSPAPVPGLHGARPRQARALRALPQEGLRGHPRSGRHRGREVPPVPHRPHAGQGGLPRLLHLPRLQGNLGQEGLAQARKLNRTCPKCSVRRLRPGKNARGLFVGCSGYPNCKHLEEKPK
ncbi:topoisomerase DNA-binding C4 zinc finger domain-containing protein [Cystobacter fuscus]